MAVPRTTVKKRFLRYTVPLVAIPIVLIIVTSLIFSHNAVIGRSREIATLRAQALYDDFDLQYRNLRNLGMDGISFYRRRLIDTFVENVTATSRDGQGVLIAADNLLRADGNGTIESRSAGAIAELVQRDSREPFTVVSSGTDLGLSGGRYVFSGRYNETPSIWIVAYERVDTALEPIITATILTSIIGMLSFLFTLFIADRIARRVSKPLASLTKAVTDFGSGNQTTRSRIDDDTEVGLLAEEFNEMADKISRFTTLLEEQVRVRTEELNHSLTELQRTQAQLVEAEKLSAVANLVAGLAHELNTPIGVAITATDYIRHNLDESDLNAQEVKRSLISSSELTLESLDRVAAMIRRLQQVTEASRAEQCETVNVHRFLCDWIESVEGRVRAKGIEISISGDREIDITTSTVYLWNVIASLIDNVLDHAFPVDAHDGNRVLIAFEREDEGVRFYVKDNGIGVAEQEIANLFEPFYTTRRDIGKVGLNLHIAHNLIQGKLGGHIQYLAPEDRETLPHELAERSGACFAIVVPSRAGCFQPEFGRS